jgi:hypothetical protein
LVEAGAVGGELPVDQLETGLELGLRRIEDVDEESSSLEMGEELVAQACAVSGALDEPRDVGDRELPCGWPVDHAEDRLERRERIVRHLRLRVRDAAQKRRLARVRQTRERRVDHELEAQLEVDLVPWKPGLREARRLPRRSREPCVAAPALAAPRSDEPRVFRGEVGDKPVVRVEELRADRDADLGVLSVRTVLLAAATVAASPRLDVLDPPEGGQVTEARIDDHDDVAAAPAVAAVRPALGDVLLPAKAQASVAATACLGMDVRPVVEHREL